MADRPPISPASPGSDRSHIPDDPEVVTVARSNNSPRPFGTDGYQEEKIVVPADENPSPYSGVAGSDGDRAPLHNAPIVAYSDAPIVADSDAPEVVPEKPTRKRKKWIIIAVVLLVAIIALAVGLGVGLSKNKKERAGDVTVPAETLDPSKFISCNTTVCPQVLSVAQFNDKTFIFGRNSDNKIAYKLGTDGSNQTWTILKDTPANIIGQPVAFSWEPRTDEPRLDVVVVTAEGNVWGSHLGNKWWSDWEAMGPYAGSQPVYCNMRQNRTDLYATDALNYNVSHTYWQTGEDEQKWLNEQGRWQILQTGPAKNAPGAVCRWWPGAKVMQDIVWYDRDERRMWHMSYFRLSTSWGTAKSFNGAWVGDPVLVSYGEDSERVDFLGIQEDHHMYHFSKEGDKIYSELNDLGGSFASVPSVVSPKTGIYDVVALGMDGYLHHTRYDNATDGWWSSWETLDIQAESAPSAILYDEEVEIVYLGKSGKLMRAAIKPDDKGSWNSSSSSYIGTGMSFTNRFIGDGL